MSDVYGETCFSQKKIYKWAEYENASMSQSWKDSPQSRNTDSPVSKSSEHSS